MRSNGWACRWSRPPPLYARSVVRIPVRQGFALVSAAQMRVVCLGYGRSVLAPSRWRLRAGCCRTSNRKVGLGNKLRRRVVSRSCQRNVGGQTDGLLFASLSELDALIIVRTGHAVCTNTGCRRIRVVRVLGKRRHVARFGVGKFVNAVPSRPIRQPRQCPHDFVGRVAKGFRFEARRGERTRSCCVERQQSFSGTGGATVGSSGRCGSNERGRRRFRERQLPISISSMPR